MFGELGVEKATLDQIAARAGVAKGTIYLYFPNKEELFRQSIRAALAVTLPDGGAAVQESPSRQLQDTIERYWRFLRSPLLKTVHQLVVGEQRDFPEVMELYATAVTFRIEADLREILEAGIANGEFREMDPGTAARVLTAVAVQSATWAAQGTAPLPGKSYDAGFNGLTEFYLQGIISVDAAFAQADGAPTPHGALNN